MIDDTSFHHGAAANHGAGGTERAASPWVNEFQKTEQEVKDAVADAAQAAAPLEKPAADRKNDAG